MTGARVAKAIAAGLACMVMAAGASAQSSSATLITPPLDINPDTTEPLIDGTGLLAPDLDLNFVPNLEVPEEPPQVATLTSTGAVIRGLDKLSGELVDFDMAQGQIAEFGRLQVEMGECRYPEDNPSGDAFAHITIRQAGEDAPVFAGWMVASSPALNALDHPRYDFWVLRCRTS
ncbi:MAG: DUF2155 domain-containing protein [Pseudomonadota bacterium]